MRDMKPLVPVLVKRNFGLACGHLADLTWVVWVIPRQRAVCRACWQKDEQRQRAG